MRKLKFEMQRSTKFHDPKIEDCSVVVLNGDNSLLWNSWNNLPDINWKEISIGYGPIQIGHIHNIKNLPVRICIDFAEINDKLIGFVNSIGRFSDSKLTREWIEKEIPRAKVTDSHNFLICVR